MHVCLVTHEFPPMTAGGISTYYSHLAQDLSDAGHTVTVLTDGKVQNEWSYPNTTVVRLPDEIDRIADAIRIVFKPQFSRTNCRYIARGIAFASWLRVHAEAGQIDVIDSIDYTGFSVFLISNDLPPVVVTSHATGGQVHFYAGYEDVPYEKQFIRSLEVMAISLADEVVAYSPANASEWQSYIGREIHFVPPPFRPMDVQPLENTAGKDELVTGVVVGRMERIKGVFELLEALNTCVEEGLPVKIVWIGRDQPYPPWSIPSIKDYIAEQYPHLWNTHFVSPGELMPLETRQIQASADFAVVPSLWESFGFAAAESMSVGTPTIISSAVGASYLCKNMENALIVPPEDTAALAAAIRQLVENPDLRKRIGEQGKQTVLEALDARMTVPERIKVYEKAIQRHQFRKTHDFAPSAMGPISEKWMDVAAQQTDTKVLARQLGSVLKSDIISMFRR
jgi:glycogen(starch) synthase